MAMEETAPGGRAFAVAVAAPPAGGGEAVEAEVCGGRPFAESPMEWSPVALPDAGPGALDFGGGGAGGASVSLTGWPAPASASAATAPVEPAPEAAAAVVFRPRSLRGPPGVQSSSAGVEACAQTLQLSSGSCSQPPHQVPSPCRPSSTPPPTFSDFGGCAVGSTGVPCGAGAVAAALVVGGAPQVGTTASSPEDAGFPASDTVTQRRCWVVPPPCSNGASVACEPVAASPALSIGRAASPPWSATAAAEAQLAVHAVAPADAAGGCEAALSATASTAAGRPLSSSSTGPEVAPPGRAPPSARSSPTSAAAGPGPGRGGEGLRPRPLTAASAAVASVGRRPSPRALIRGVAERGLGGSVGASSTGAASPTSPSHGGGGGLSGGGAKASSSVAAAVGPGARRSVPASWQQPTGDSVALRHAEATIQHLEAQVLELRSRNALLEANQVEMWAELEVSDRTGGCSARIVPPGSNGIAVPWAPALAFHAGSGGQAPPQQEPLGSPLAAGGGGGEDVDRSMQARPADVQPSSEHAEIERLRRDLAERDAMLLELHEEVKAQSIMLAELMHEARARVPAAAAPSARRAVSPRRPTGAGSGGTLAGSGARAGGPARGGGGSGGCSGSSNASMRATPPPTPPKVSSRPVR